jgi:hypothetical protein
MDERRAEIEVEVQRYSGALRQAIRAAGFSVSEVERRLGAGPKSLRRVFGGQVDLKFKHVVAVLRIIGLSQQQFFAIACRDRRRRSAGGEFLATFERIGYRGEFVPVADDAEDPSDEEFDRMVEDAVERVLRRRAKGGEPSAEQPPPAETPPAAPPARPPRTRTAAAHPRPAGPATHADRAGEWPPPE